MEPNKPVEIQEEKEEIYTPGQRFILKIFQWGAWTAGFVALMSFLHSR